MMENCAENNLYQLVLSSKKFENSNEVQNIQIFCLKIKIDFYQSNIEILYIKWQKIIDNVSNYIID